MRVFVRSVALLGAVGILAACSTSTSSAPAPDSESSSTASVSADVPTPAQESAASATDEPMTDQASATAGAPLTWPEACTLVQLAVSKVEDADYGSAAYQTLGDELSDVIFRLNDDNADMISLLGVATAVEILGNPNADIQEMIDAEAKMDENYPTFLDSCGVPEQDR